jgi:reactive intermediate/imine deaminase
MSAAAILTERAPIPAGHYAQARVHAGVAYLSGQLPIRPDGAHDPAASFEDQARQALANLFAVLEAAGGSPDRVLKVTAYIVGVEHWPRFNAVYAEAFGDARPARSVVPVPELHHGYLVEIDAVAAVGPSAKASTAP